MATTTGTKAGLASGGILVTALAMWQAWPMFDAIIFTQAEASDVAQVMRRVIYSDKVELAKLKLFHATDDAERAEIQSEIDYYTDRIRELDIQPGGVQ